MTLVRFLFVLLTMVGISSAVNAQERFDVESNIMDELDPYDPNIEQTLRDLDRVYVEETGELPFEINLFSDKNNCYRASCKIWVQVARSTQKLYLYVDGKHTDTWLVSTGTKGHGTPNFDTHPNGRIYDRYTSTKYPGGDYKGLGNMPYAIFIQGGFAVHGTSKSNWPKLGSPASHGCIRVHPDYAFKLNRLVRAHGIHNTWITVQP